MKKTQTSLTILISLALFSILLAADESLEYRLAVVNAGGYVPKDHITVKRFKSLLDQLSKTYVENKEQIADMSAKAKQLLEEKGIRESILNIMEGMNKIFTKPIENQKYAEYVSAYVVLRDKGRSHSQAIGDLKAIINSLK